MNIHFILKHSKIILLSLILNTVILSDLKSQSLDTIGIKQSATSNYSEKNWGYFRLPFYPNKTLFSNEDELPLFPGGEDSLQSFITKNLKIPEVYLHSKINTIVWIPLWIDNDGSLSLNASVVCDFDFIDEAGRLMELMPKWIPANCNGKPVYSSVLIPIFISGKH